MGDLRQAIPDGYHSILLANLAGDNIVSGWPYNGSVSHHVTQGSMEEWQIFGGEGMGLQHQHPYHQHTTHFQIMHSNGPNGVDSNSLMGQVGDYRDSVPLWQYLNFTIRMIFPFCGKMMVHCHVFTHEDRGMMTLINVSKATNATSLWKSLELHDESKFLV